MFIFEAVKNYYYGNVNKKIPVFFLEKRLLANKTKYRDFPLHYLKIFPQKNLDLEQAPSIILSIKKHENTIR